MQATEEPTVPADPSLALGRYRLGPRLGAGGFGTVYEARDERLNRRVALKVIPSDGQADDRARREAHAVARLDHPGIVAVFDAGEEDGSRFLVSELVCGATLAQLEAAGALSDRDAVRIGLALAAALAHAHERGVIHRDVKPQNVMIPARPRAPYGAAKLTDFGVAHLAGDEPLTRTGDVVGTLAYMAPEQAAGERVDERVDLYALGLVLYEALAGVNPVRAGGPAATARRLGTVLPRLDETRRDLPADLCRALDRTLRPRPEERGTLMDLTNALGEALPALSGDGGAVAPHPLEGSRGLPPATARLAAAAAAGCLVALALIGLLPQPPLPALAAGVAAALLVALVPAAGWGLAATATVGAIAFAAEPRPGAALIVMFAAIGPPLLLRGAGPVWSLPAAAPLLGLAGLAGAFPALAGRARSGWTRVALGALGLWWLLLAEPLLGRTLLFGAVDGTPPRAGWDGAAGLAASEVVVPLATSGAVALAAVWAAGALVLPWLVRGRHLAFDVVTAAMWAAGLAAASVSVAQAVSGSSPRGVVAGALAAGALSVALRWTEGLREGDESEYL
ncbi:MAG TPA: serine/threonine-protein kinase [Solirubrobacteraceae bacterium]|nr:serine/threonine-protein kinase [Solirubrobacteraceae bacterium]